uniref:Uncharacterized protein n=1 Tax=viral metagenome TaxID=1070528 RepID=A0A6C0I9R6_9ZZZZ
MCWNAAVSLNTYVFGLFASSFAYYNGITNLLGLIFYQSFIIMQLIEYFIWSKTFPNRLLSHIALLVILCIPIFNIIKIEKIPELIPYILVAYLAFIVILYTAIIPLNTIEFSSVPSKNGHLSWKWLTWNIYIILIWYAFLSLRWIIDKMYPTLIFVSIFLIISIILYKETNTWGSMWCWICNIISFCFILLVFNKDFCKM